MDFPEFPRNSPILIEFGLIRIELARFPTAVLRPARAFVVKSPLSSQSDAGFNKLAAPKHCSKLSVRAKIDRGELISFPSVSLLSISGAIRRERTF